MLPTPYKYNRLHCHSVTMGAIKDPPLAFYKLLNHCWNWDSCQGVMAMGKPWRSGSGISNLQSKQTNGVPTRTLGRVSQAGHSFPVISSLSCQIKVKRPKIQLKKKKKVRGACQTLSTLTYNFQKLRRPSPSWHWAVTVRSSMKALLGGWWMPGLDN